MAHDIARAAAPRAFGAALVVSLLPLVAGCTPGALLGRAIDARGGPIGGLVRVSEATVHAEYPGRWRWQTIFGAPDRYAWSIETTGDPTHYLFDGTLMRSFVGEAEAAVEPAASAPLRSHARLMAVMLLAALERPGVTLRELDEAARPSDAAAALEVVFVDDGARFTVALDERLLVRAVEGILDLPPRGRRRVRVELTDHRRVDGLLVPRRARWTVEGVRLVDERVLRACVLPTPPARAHFRRPGALPACPP